MMKLQRLFAITISLTLAAAAVAADPVTAPRTDIKSLEDIAWLLGTSEGTEVLVADIPGFGKKGESARLQVATEELMGGKYLFATGTLIKGDETFAAFTEVWGMDTAGPGVRKWVFDASGATLEGKVYWEGDDRIVHIVEGELAPREEPFKKIAQALNVDKLPYYGEIVFRRVDDKTVGVTVQAVKIGGAPFPWPNMNKENLFRGLE